MATRLLVLGQGYVGLPLAMQAVEAGYDVLGYDTDVARVARLLQGDSYIEDVPRDVLVAALSTGRYRATYELDDCAGFDVAVITVPTPMRQHHPDLSFVEAASRMLGPLVRPGCTVVLESTTYPGTTEELVKPILEEASGLAAGDDFALGYSPERIDPGNRTWTLQTIPKVVSGIDERSCKAVQAFYDDVVDTTVPVSGTREAELSKLIENTFRHVNIALVNELAVFASELGIDVWEALDAAATKPFGFMRFDPSPGVGGHCLPIDPNYLSWAIQRDLGRSFRFVELAREINDRMPEEIVRRCSLILNREGIAVSQSRVLLLGLAYKRNSGDVRESPSLRVAQRLCDLGAQVRAADPHVPLEQTDDRIVRVPLEPDELWLADLVVVLTDHEAFDLRFVADRARCVFDTRHHVPPGRHVEYL